MLWTRRLLNRKREANLSDLLVDRIFYCGNDRLIAPYDSKRHVKFVVGARHLHTYKGTICTVVCALQLGLPSIQANLDKRCGSFGTQLQVVRSSYLDEHEEAKQTCNDDSSSTYLQTSGMCRRRRWQRQNLDRITSHPRLGKAKLGGNQGLKEDRT